MQYATMFFNQVIVAFDVCARALISFLT